MMLAAIAGLVVAGIAAGPLLARVRMSWLRRGCGWLLLAGLVVGAEWVLADADAVSRMVGICCVLLGAMKGLVYAEGAGADRLPPGRYAVFAFCWFGMDPGSFRTRRNGLAWKRDVAIGLLHMALGTLGAWGVWSAGWRQILVRFVPMSLGFHFGALRVLKGGLRAAGFPVRTLFPNVLEAKGIGDFWSKRWTTGYSQMMQRIVGKPIARHWGNGAGLMAVVLVSGLLHELAITLPARAGYGLPTLYFTLHGVCTLLENKLGRPIGKIPALILIALPLDLLFPATFRHEVIERCLDIFSLLA